MLSASVSSMPIVLFKVYLSSAKLNLLQMFILVHRYLEFSRIVTGGAPVDGISYALPPSNHSKTHLTRCISFIRGCFGTRKFPILQGKVTGPYGRKIYRSKLENIMWYIRQYISNIFTIHCNIFNMNISYVFIYSKIYAILYL